jgi:hypothetical protein
LIQLIKSIQDQAQQLMMDMYGNHVIQSFLNAFKAAEKPEEEDVRAEDQAIRAGGDGRSLSRKVRRRQERKTSTSVFR